MAKPPSVRDALKELVAIHDNETRPATYGVIRWEEREAAAWANARAALAAPPSEIPREPTQAMLDAVGCATFDVSWDALTPIWQAMYDAAKSAVSDPPPAKDNNG